ncbi:hypothetical protein JD969_13660 [Planctomycetota bacterium]|nr:hypothetical protein JD969_13660 [Planctomycetota bacterium]
MKAKRFEVLGEVYGEDVKGVLLNGRGKYRVYGMLNNPYFLGKEMAKQEYGDERWVSWTVSEPVVVEIDW